MSKQTAHNDALIQHEQAENEFEPILQKVLARRRFLQGSAGLGIASFFAMNPLASVLAGEKTRTTLLNFKAIPASTKDQIIVPEGYKSQILVSWGDPILKGAAKFNERQNTAEEQLSQFGDNNDGMSFFAFKDASGKLDPNRALLVINNEYHNPEYLFSHGESQVKSLEDARKAQAATGVSIIEIQKNKNNFWQRVENSQYNRRFHMNTSMEITGPARAHKALQSALHQDGIKVSGTANNCANGQTPWGTYLTCEENFDGYFGTGNEEFKPDASQKRYGLKATPEEGREFFQFDERFDLGKHPNEANTFGWVVEIDPFDPLSTPKKRSALGRFKHENAEVVVNKDGHVVVYMGDDERGEFLYKFVSKNKFNATTPEDPKNRDLLAEGTLFVARYSDKKPEGAEKNYLGAGEWLPLVFGQNGLTAENGFHSQADVVINARLAASLLGATAMDRPEWVAVHPLSGEIFYTLTNNKYRGVKENQPVNAMNPRAENPYGHIIRMKPHNDDHTSAQFVWDIFVLAGNPLIQEGLMAGSSNITQENMFNSPDGLGFDQEGRLWILTDGNYSNEGDFKGMGNNQMLCADPASGEIRRFLTGPIACEITGIAFSEDYKTLFVNVQHPGENNQPSSFPHGDNKKIPRSSVVMVVKEDGGVIGQ